MPQSVFGVGHLFAIPTGANPTPTKFGALQDVNVDFQFDLKLLYGSKQFPLEQARGKGKIDLKATIGRIDPALFNNIFFGGSLSVGESLFSVDEVGIVPSTPYQVTVANAANFSVDLGVYDTNTGLFLTRVASAPAAGQYAVSAGVYTFNSGAATHSVRISYTYASGSTGSTLAYTNQDMGAGIIFGVRLAEAFTGAAGKKTLSLYFPAVQSPKLSMPLKLDDFTLPQIELSAQDDGSGNVFTYTMTG